MKVAPEMLAGLVGLGANFTLTKGPNDGCHVRGRIAGSCEESLRVGSIKNNECAFDDLADLKFLSMCNRSTELGFGVIDVDNKYALRYVADEFYDICYFPTSKFGTKCNLNMGSDANITVDSVSLLGPTESVSGMDSIPVSELLTYPPFESWFGSMGFPPIASARLSRTPSTLPATAPSTFASTTKSSKARQSVTGQPTTRPSSTRSSSISSKEGTGSPTSIAFETPTETQLTHGQDSGSGQDFCHDDNGKKYSTAPRVTSATTSYDPCHFSGTVKPIPYDTTGLSSTGPSTASTSISSGRGSSSRTRTPLTTPIPTQLTHGADPASGENYCHDDNGNKYSMAPRMSSASAYDPCYFGSTAKPIPYDTPRSSKIITDEMGTVRSCPSAVPNDLRVHDAYDCGPSSTVVSTVTSIAQAYSSRVSVSLASKASASAAASAAAAKFEGRVIIAFRAQAFRRPPNGGFPQPRKQVNDWAIFARASGIFDMCEDEPVDRYAPKSVLDVAKTKVPYPDTDHDIQDFKMGDHDMDCKYKAVEDKPGTLECAGWDKIQCEFSQYGDQVYGCKSSPDYKYVVPKVQCVFKGGDKE
ncbi:hypothetical protein N7512_007593 [Penicillium capsulatum]|nr:hypothetical protein N7512_007593 [Penicillium capsulatum]